MPPLFFGLYRARKRPKASTTSIEQDISAIGRCTSNKHQLAQFGTTVQSALKEKPRKAGDIEKKLQDIVGEVKRKIGALDVDGQEHRESCRGILQWGSDEIRSILQQNGKSQRKIRKRVEEENQAIQQDMKLDQNIVRNSLMAQPKSGWTVYFMDDPKKDPLILEVSFYGYDDVMYYLNSENIIKSPELWIKRSDGDVQTFTSSRSWWIYVEPSESVGEMALYVVNMQKRNHSTYTVALVKDGDDREFPVPIDNGTLGKHLGYIWRDQYRVCSARKFDSPGQNVLGLVLDTIQFKIRKNELYITVKKLGP
ncbi:hypothetical protein FRC17_010469 [Serendipita sp. 399]|nr:hypothetical protein FRC17_010469 [Serendipita sp. 399]